MGVRKFKFLVVLIFLGIFSAKMVISIAPLFITDLDKKIVNNVIMQLELEQNGEKDTTKSSVKFLESKFFHNDSTFFFIANNGFALNNSFIEHAKRYVNPYNPSVLTPPPNFS